MIFVACGATDEGGGKEACGCVCLSKHVTAIFSVWNRRVLFLPVVAPPWRALTTLRLMAKFRSNMSLALECCPRLLCSTPRLLQAASCGMIAFQSESERTVEIRYGGGV